MLHLLGIDHEQLTCRFGGRDFRLTDVHDRSSKRFYFDCSLEGDAQQKDVESSGLVAIDRIAVPSVAALLLDHSVSKWKTEADGIGTVGPKIQLCQKSLIFSAN